MKEREPGFKDELGKWGRRAIVIGILGLIAVLAI